MGRGALLISIAQDAVKQAAPRPGRHRRPGELVAGCQAASSSRRRPGAIHGRLLVCDSRRRRLDALGAVVMELIRRVAVQAGRSSS